MDNAAMFDRCISLTFYDSSGHKLGVLNTPSRGCKPDIVIEGEYVSMNTSVSNTVTVTNLDPCIAVNDIAYIWCTMYYGDMKANPMAYTQLYLSVLYADQTKGPPDRQTTFQCTTCATDNSILGAKWQFTPAKDAKTGKIRATYLGDFLSEWIKQYNESVKTALPSGLAVDLPLSETVDSSSVDVADYVNAEILIGDSKPSDTLYTIFNDVSSRLLKTITVNGKKVVFQHMFLSVQDGAVHVMYNPLPSGATSSTPALGSIVFLNNIITAYRYGIVVRVKSLFDPRVKLGTILAVTGSAINGRRVAGNLVATTSDITLIQSTAGLKFKFGTMNGNEMNIVGTIKS